jgi:GNAT superfamily N-acetyltransferase
MLEAAHRPALLPDAEGRWALNPLRWALLRSALDARVDGGRLARLLSRQDEAFAGHGLAGPEPLRPDHVVAGFDCGAEMLNMLLAQSLSDAVDPAKPALETFVLRAGAQVAAYYAVRPVRACREGAPEEAALPLHLLARFAVDRRWRRPGLAEALFAKVLTDAIASEPRPAAILGFAFSPAAKRFFRRCGARPAGDLVEPRAMIVATADIDRAMAERR